MRLVVLLCLAAVLSLSGCAASQRQVIKKDTVDIKIQQFETRIAQLEKETQQKDKKIVDLENKLTLARKELNGPVEVNGYSEKNTISSTAAMAAKKTEVDISQATPKRIQTALKKAGFYSGPIDGKIGENTRKAIKDFQRANSLKVDGLVGKGTWAQLHNYL